MAKFNTKLPRDEVKKIFYQLCLAVSEIKNPEEAAELLRDILSFQEAEMIAKRFKIAELLLKNSTYEEIQEQLKVSAATVARVQEWLKVSGVGYKKAVQRTQGKTPEKRIENYNPGSWLDLKKRYPSYYWPQLLLENIIDGANARQIKKIDTVMKTLERSKEKSALFKKIQQIIRKRGR